MKTAHIVSLAAAAVLSALQLSALGLILRTQPVTAISVQPHASVPASEIILPAVEVTASRTS